MSNRFSESAENLARVRERIEHAASRAGRQAEGITLIAVSKMHSAAQIRALYDSGVRHFGENRVQEWESKRANLADLDATWHMIGHLQSNKAARTVRLFDCVDSVDSVGLAERLDRARKDFNTEVAESTKKNGAEEKRTGQGGDARLRVLVEVMLDPGGTKSGVAEGDLPVLVEAVLGLPHLELRGLMGVPPYFDDPEKARPYFRRLRELRDSIRARLENNVLPALSMGMSHDFEVAIEEGATEIRVGTALFGEREKV
jgi:pyridoxal phosphate enzyme (YggS family)